MYEIILAIQCINIIGIFAETVIIFGNWKNRLHGWLFLNCVVQLVDETDHYIYMEELEKQKSRADSANQAKSAFLANMSHDIRTPINAVLGMNEMILRECNEEQIIGYSAKIKSAGNTLLGLINDILDFSKIEAGKLDIIPVDYDLVNMIQPRADAKGLTLSIEGTGLGMSITRRLLSMMDSRLDVQSEYRKGSMITLPSPLSRRSWKKC